MYYSIFGIAMTLCGVTFLFIQILLNLMFTIHPNYNRHMAFRIMFHLGLTDCILLSGLAYEGFVWFSGQQAHTTIEKIMGSLMRGGSDANFCMQLVLAINRFLASQSKAKNLANSFYTALLLICWTIFASAFFSYLTPYCSASLHNTARAWLNQDRCAATFVYKVRFAEKILKAGACVTTFAFYVAALWLMFKKRQKYHNQSMNLANVAMAHAVARNFATFAPATTSPSALSRRSRSEQLERHILIYALLVFAAGFISLICGYIYNSGHNVLLVITSDVTWELSCIMRCCSLLVLNRELKQRFVNFIKSGHVSTAEESRVVTQRQFRARAATIATIFLNKGNNSMTHLCHCNNERRKSESQCYYCK